MVPPSLNDLNADDLTDNQFWLAGWCAVKGHPRILASRREVRAANDLTKKGWGTVEPGASGQRIFRLNQAGCDAFAWLDKLKVV